MTGEADIIVSILFWDWGIKGPNSWSRNVFWKVRIQKLENNWSHRFLPALGILFYSVMSKTFVIIIFDCALCWWKNVLIYIDEKSPVPNHGDTTLVFSGAKLMVFEPVPEFHCCYFHSYVYCTFTKHWCWECCVLSLHHGL